MAEAEVPGVAGGEAVVGESAFVVGLDHREDAGGGGKVGAFDDDPVLGDRLSGFIEQLALQLHGREQDEVDFIGFAREHGGLVFQDGGHVGGHFAGHGEVALAIEVLLEMAGQVDGDGGGLEDGFGGIVGAVHDDSGAEAHGVGAIGGGGGVAGADEAAAAACDADLGARHGLAIGVGHFAEDGPWPAFFGFGLRHLGGLELEHHGLISVGEGDLYGFILEGVFGVAENGRGFAGAERVDARREVGEGDLSGFEGNLGESVFQVLTGRPSHRIRAMRVCVMGDWVPASTVLRCSAGPFWICTVTGGGW